MDPSVLELWQTASGAPFLPTVGKGSQFTVGFLLLVIGLGLTGAFTLSEFSSNLRSCIIHSHF